MTTPALRVRWPIAAFAPTFHARPIASATSTGARRPMSASVTTAISPPLFWWTSNAMRLM